MNISLDPAHSASHNCAMMKRLLTVSSFALLCFCAPAIAQDAEEFDPYAAYKDKSKSDEVSSDLPEPSETEETANEEIIEIPLNEGMTREETERWADDIEATSKAQAEEEAAAESEELEIPDDLENYISSDEYFRDKAKEPIPLVTVKSAEELDIALDEEAALEENEAEVEAEIVASEEEKEEDLAPEPEPEPESEPVSEPKVEPEPEPEPEKETKPAAKTTGLPVSAFYLTADEYRAQRKSGEQEQLVLNYSISRKPLAGAGASSQRSLTLILGSDFAFATFTGAGEDQPARIYDFEQNRLLQLSLNSSGQIGFTNGSLYAPTLRNTRLIAALTENGKAAMVQAGPTQSLHPVWVEAAMSYTLADRRDDFDVEFNRNFVSASFDGEDVFNLTFADKEFPNRDMSDVFLAYAHHAMAIHPALLRYLYAAERPPEKIEITLYGPETPGGAVETWELTEMAVTEAGFPLPASAIGVTHDSDDPLTTALRASFDSPAPTLKELGNDVTSAINDDAPFAALLAAQRYQDYAGPCSDRAGDPICMDIDLLMVRSDLPENAKIIAKAFRDAKSRPRYGKAVSALLPYLEGDDAPAAALYTAGITRAKLTDLRAADAGVSNVDPEPLLMRALMLDPHNPSYLLGLAQLFAVKDRYEAAWDIQDSLRIVLDSEPLDGTTLTSPIVRMESSIEKDAPGYFAR